MESITLRGRRIPLLYTTWEMKTVQEEIAPISRAIAMVLGRNPDDDKDTSRYAGAEHLAAVAALIRILGNAGLEEAGEEPNLTDKWILRGLRPAELADAINICMGVMDKGMRSEIPEKKPEGPIDVTLEEMNKKKETES
jgi:hypothetical protein